MSQNCPHKCHIECGRQKLLSSGLICSVNDCNMNWLNLHPETSDSVASCLLDMISTQNHARHQLNEHEKIDAKVKGSKSQDPNIEPEDEESSRLL